MARRSAVRRCSSRQRWRKASTEPRSRSCPNTYVFTRHDGLPLTPETISKRFQVLAQLAGLPRIRLHDLRHTHASHALAANVSMKVVQERLGHSSMALTADTYTHVLPTVAAEAAELVANLLASAVPALAEREHDTIDWTPLEVAATENTQVNLGRPPGARTLNQRIKSPLLYPLS